jgi:hypothetical protein
MDKHLAFAILKVDSDADKETIEDAMVSQIFELRSYFLRQPIVAALYLRRIEKCYQLFEIATLLEVDLSGDYIHSDIPLAEGNVIDILKNYEAATSLLRLQVAQTMHPKSIGLVAKNLVAVQHDFEQYFLSVTSGELATPVLAADQLNTGRLLRLLAINPHQQEVVEMIARERTRILGLTRRTQEK